MDNDRMSDLQKKLEQKTKQENKNVNNDENNNDDKIVLENKNKIENNLQRKTYYLEPKHIDMIEELKERSGYAKYELVQLAIEILYNRAKIE